MSHPRTAPPTAAPAVPRAALAAVVAVICGIAAPVLEAGPPSAVRVSRGAMSRLRPALDEPKKPVEPGAQAPAVGAAVDVPAVEPETADALPELALRAQAASVPADWTKRGEGVTDRRWRWVVVHHTATAAGDVATIHAAHRRRKDSAGNPWRGVGYHFVIGNGEGMSDGAVEATFRWRGQLSGAHAGDAAANDRGVGVAFVGDFTKTDPTPAQLAAARRLIVHLRAKYRIPADRVLPHGALVATKCPGPRLKIESLLEGPAKVDPVTPRPGRASALRGRTQEDAPLEVPAPADLAAPAPVVGPRLPALAFPSPPRSGSQDAP